MRGFSYLLLGRREYSVWELKARLQKKWPHLDSVSGLIEDLVAEDLVSDQRYAEAFLRSKTQRFQGPMKILAGLRAKRVPGDITSSVLDTHSAEWTDLAADWLNRKGVVEISREDRPKHYRRMLNRGFTHDQAMDAMNRI